MAKYVIHCNILVKEKKRSLVSPLAGGVCVIWVNG